MAPRESKDAGRIYRFTLGGEWGLDDLYEFPRLFHQLYAFQYSFRPLDEGSERSMDRLEMLFTSYPWRGGYSAVNFYLGLQHSIPREDRPIVRSLQMASPGWLDLSLCVDVAKDVGIIVGAFVGSGLGLNRLYHSIYKGMQERKLLKIKVQSAQVDLASKHHDFIATSCRELARALRFKHLAALNALTKSELASLKVLLSVFRRARDLAKMEEADKLTFEARASKSKRKS